MKKRVLSLALAAAMALSLAPAALAAEEDCDPIIIGGNRGERPPTDPYKDHIDTLDEAHRPGQCGLRRGPPLQDHHHDQRGG